MALDTILVLQPVSRPSTALPLAAPAPQRPAQHSRLFTSPSLTASNQLVRSIKQQDPRAVAATTDCYTQRKLKSDI